MGIAELAATVASPIGAAAAAVDGAPAMSGERRCWSQIEAYTGGLIRSHAERHGDSPADDLALSGWLAYWDGEPDGAEELLEAALALDQRRSGLLMHRRASESRIASAEAELDRARRAVPASGSRDLLASIRARLRFGPEAA